MYTVPRAFMFPATAAELLAESRARREAFIAARPNFTETPDATREVIRVSAQIMDRRKAQVTLPPGAKDRRFSATLPTGWGDFR